MQSEAQESAPAAPTATGPLPRYKFRIRFRKSGDLRLVSHHDLLHCLERMLRRAGLPVGATQGFNPRPRLWFAQSLALGIVGLHEVLELELTEPLAAAEVQRRLADQCPPGLAILAVQSIDRRASAQVRRAHFRLPLTDSLVADAGSVGARTLAASATVASLGLPERCQAFLSEDHHWIERTRPQRRCIDLRPYVAALEPQADGLAMVLWITPHGAARPEEIVDALGLHDLLVAGAVLERTDLELVDELQEDAPLPVALTTPPNPKEPSHAKSEDRTEHSAPASKPTALITGPLSFDS
jgi:radical SAM-linked protein